MLPPKILGNLKSMTSCLGLATGNCEGVFHLNWSMCELVVLIAFEYHFLSSQSYSSLRFFRYIRFHHSLASPVEVENSIPLSSTLLVCIALHRRKSCTLVTYFRILILTRLWHIVNIVIPLSFVLICGMAISPFC